MVDEGVLRVVLADDNYLVREGTRLLLEDSGRVRVIAAAADAAELLTAADEHRPDVVLTDIRMPPGHDVEGIEAARRLRLHYPELGVVVLSQYADPAYALALFRDGADGLGYLLKERVGDLEELEHALRTVASGGSVVDPKVLAGLVGARESRQRSGLSDLSGREVEVLREMARGANNAGVAEALVISESAVEKHVSQIFLKLGVAEQPLTSRRVAAVLTFLAARGGE